VRQEALLLDARGLGIALDHDQPAQHGAVFARHFLPGGLGRMLAAGDAPILDLRRQQDAPAVFRHLHVVELRPALGIDADRGAQIDQRLLEVVGDQVVPPVDVAGVPLLQRLEHPLVARKTDIVGDLRVVADIDQVEHRCLLCGWRGGSQTRAHVEFAAPAAAVIALQAVALQAPTALGRWKIQFCQAVSRPKMRVSIVSGPAKRRFASIPVSASGLNEARSSRKMRNSSSQSMSS
jgi:hypothetical protein